METVEKKLLNKMKKHANLLLVFSVTCLILIHFLPWVVVSDQTVGDSNIVFFNYEMMKKSYDFEIVKLASIIDGIVFLVWGMVLLGLSCFVGVGVYLSRRFRIVSFPMIGLGFFISFLNIIAVYLSLRFTQNVEGLRSISLAYLFNPFSYPSIVFVFMVLSFFVSLFISIDSIMFFRMYYKNLKSRKKKKISFESSKPQVSISGVEKTFSGDVIHASVVKKPEEWSGDAKQEEGFKKEDMLVEENSEERKMRETDEMKAVSADLEQEKGSTGLEDEEKTVAREEGVDVIKKKEESKPSRFDDTFEQVLFSAIEKKKKDFGKKDLDETSAEKTEKGFEGVKKFKVRCLKCKNEFIAEVRDGDKRVKCPACGEEGEL